MLWSLVLLLSSAVAAPFKITVISEPGARERAQEFIREVSNLEPFRQLIAQRGLTISRTPVIIQDLNCRGGAFNIVRLAQCDMDRVARPCRDADFCPLFTAVPTIGAGYQRTPIASSSYPWTTMLHEMMHSFGFTDDYPYPTADTRTYCPHGPWPNGHTDGDSNSYRSAAEAQRACVRRISWCQKAIDAGTPVVQPQSDGTFAIGSPVPAEGCPSVKLGVYLGGNCENQNPLSTWRSNYCPNVMGFPLIGEEVCPSQRRHLIIQRSPNLLTPYFQEVIFKQVVERKRLRGLVFTPSPAQTAPADFRYGIPELDRIMHPSGPLPDLCTDTETAKLPVHKREASREIATSGQPHVRALCIH